MLRRLLAVTACIAAIVVLGAGSAFAGEVTGNGKQTPIGAAPEDAPHAASICSFSGQNDGEPPPGRVVAGVQNWGQEADRQSLPAFLHPGESCNGHTGFFAG